MLTWYLPGRSGPLKKTDVKPLSRNGDHVNFIFSAWLLPISRLASRKVCFPGCRIYRPFPLIRTVLLSFVSSEIVSALCCWPWSLLLTYHEEVSCNHVNSTDWSKFQLVSSRAISRIHQFLMFCAWHLGVCWLGRHMIAETSAVWLERFFPCFTMFLLYPLLRSMLIFCAPWAPFSMSSCDTWPSDAMGHTGHRVGKGRGMYPNHRKLAGALSLLLILIKNNYIVRIILMFFTSTRKGSNQCNSRYIIYRSGRNQRKFQGPPIVGPPFPYYAHTTTIRILWSMGWYCNFMGRGTSVGSWRDPSEVVVHGFFLQTFPWLPSLQETSPSPPTNQN